MKTKDAIVTHDAAQLRQVTADIQGMYHPGGGEKSSVALTFRGVWATGLHVGFHASTSEMRAFAHELIRHCDVTDAAQAAADMERAA